MHNDNLGPSMVQTTVLLHTTLRTASAWHACTRVHPHLSPYLLAAIVRKYILKLTLGKALGWLLGIQTGMKQHPHSAHRLEKTPLVPKLQVSVQELSCLKRPRWCSSPLQLCQDPSWEAVCTQAPHLRDHRVGSVNAEGCWVWRRGKSGFKPG